MSSKSLMATKLYAEREKTGDITFIVDLERIKAHKCVLAALSPKYEAQFYGNQQPEDNEVYVEDISPAAFEEFIKFCYIEDCDLSIVSIEELLDLAKQSLMTHFVTKCGQFLINTINMGYKNICWIYRLALMYDIKAVQDLCELRIEANLPQIFKTADFLECDREVLIHILDIKTFNCTEVEIFEGCIAWARAECQRKEIDDNQPMNLRAVLGPAMDHIHFRAMNINQFVELDGKYEGFFSAEKFREIVKVIVDVDRCVVQNQTTNESSCSWLTNITISDVVVSEAEDYYEPLIFPE